MRKLCVLVFPLVLLAGCGRHAPSHANQPAIAVPLAAPTGLSTSRSTAHESSLGSPHEDHLLRTNVMVHFCHAGNCDDTSIHNLRTNGGADMQAQQMATTGAQPAPANYVALTNDAATPAATDCAAGASSCPLASEIVTNGVGRAQAAYAHTNGTNVITLSITFTFTGTQSVQKAGLFNNATPGSGIMFLEFNFPQRNAVASDTLVITWTENI